MQSVKINTKNITAKGGKILEKAYRLGVEYEKSRHACSQCVVAALQQALQVKDESIFQAAYPLAGGVGNTTSGNCGALSGGAMILGCLYGRSREEFKQNTPNKRATYLAKRLHDRFIQEYGSCRCKDIQTKLFGRSFNFWDEKDKKAFEEAGGHRDKCPIVVGKAATWTVEIIQEEMKGTFES